MGFFKAIFGSSNDKKEKEVKPFIIDKMINQYGQHEQEGIIENAKVIFPPDSDKIIINGETFYFNAKRIDYEGFDEEFSCYKISTYEFDFWVSSKITYTILKTIMENRHKDYMEEEKLKIRKEIAENNAPFEYDNIDNDIYNCFIAHKTGMNIKIAGTEKCWEKFETIESELNSICKEHGGKYYKSAAKSAKFAILFSPVHRTATNVKQLRSKGYKVTSFENMIDYLGLNRMWNTKGIIDEVKRFKEYRG